MAHLTRAINMDVDFVADAEDPSLANHIHFFNTRIPPPKPYDDASWHRLLKHASTKHSLETRLQATQHRKRTAEMQDHFAQILAAQQQPVQQNQLQHIQPRHNQSSGSTDGGPGPALSLTPTEEMVALRVRIRRLTRKVQIYREEAAINWTNFINAGTRNEKLQAFNDGLLVNNSNVNAEVEELSEQADQLIREVRSAAHLLPQQPAGTMWILQAVSNSRRAREGRRTHPRASNAMTLAVPKGGLRFREMGMGSGIGRVRETVLDVSEGIKDMDPFGDERAALREDWGTASVARPTARAEVGAVAGGVVSVAGSVVGAGVDVRRS